MLPRTKLPALSVLARQRQKIALHERILEQSVRERTAELEASLEALSQSKERYQRLLESITSYVYTVRMEEGRPAATRHGPGCLAVTGYAPEAFQENPYLWIEMVHPEDRDTVSAEAEALLAERRARSFEHRIHHQDGTVRWVRSVLVPHLAPGGALAAYDGVIIDITERKRAEEARIRLEAQLFQAQRLESLGNLAGGVAHDINNVLAAILGLSSSNREQVPAGPLARSLDTITTACLRGREVVRSLLYFARKDMAAVGPVDLNLLVRQIVPLLEATTLKRIRIETELQEPLGPLEGEEAALSHALMNLCVNALDAMPDGGTLTLRTRGLARGGLEVRVRDTGGGMSAEVLAKAIDPFFTTKPVGKGTGLGLAMVYGTMKAHGGTLELRSQPGLGTEATLAFPTPREAGKAAAAPAAPAPRPGAGLRILLVDDDELIRLSIPAMLEALGHTTETAESGPEALERIRGGLEPDLVILDMRMPEMGGAEVLPRLLALRPALPVLLATGHADQEMQDLLADRPGVAWIQKPFTLAEIRDKVEDLRVRRP